MTIVSNNIKYLRRLNGLTQEQFARRIGIKRSLLGAYEEARANPNLENLKMIAQVFGTSVDALIKTDIRRIRETPGINLIQSPNGIAQMMTAQANKPEPSAFIEPPKPITDETPPQRIATVVDKYLRDKEQVTLISQRIFPKKVRAISLERTNELVTATSIKQVENPIPMPTVQENKVVSGVPMVALVKQQQQKDYAVHYQRKDFIAELPVFSFPVDSQEEHRAFEIGDDFPLNNALVIGKKVPNFGAIKDGKHHLLVGTQGQVIYRRIYNQSKIKGTLLLSSDNHAISSVEVPIKEVCEVWEAISFFSNQLPETLPPLDKIRGLINELNVLIGE